MRLIVSGDVVSTLELRYGIGLYPNQDRQLNDIEQNFLNDLGSSIFNDYAFHVLTNREIIELYQQHRDESGLPIVSIDDLWEGNNIFHLQLNRELDLNSGNVYLAPRAGFASLEIQARNLAANLPQREVMLVDRGSINGGTILFSSSLLAKYGIQVRKVVLGPYRKEGLDRLKHELGSSIDVSVLSGHWRCDEWVESRDLVGVSGRILKGGGYSPYFAQPQYISARINEYPSFREQCEYFLKEVEMRVGIEVSQNYF